MAFLINLLIILLIGGIIFYLVRNYCPEPPRTIVLIVLMVIAIIYLIGLLPGVGYAPGFYTGK